MLTIDRILVPTDFSTCADQAFAHAVRRARVHDAGVHLLHVVPVAPAHPMLGVQATPAERDDLVREELRNVVETHSLDELPVDLAVEHGEEVASTILDYAKTNDIDLIVSGTHGRRGMRRLMLGSTAEEVIRQSDRPVLAVREHNGDEPPLSVDRLLVPVDLSEHSRGALQHADHLADHHDARLDLVHVVEPLSDYDPSGPYRAALPSESNALSSVKENVRDRLRALSEELALPDERVRIYVGEGAPVPFIVDVAEEEEVDLIVLASHGRTGLERFLLGSVAEKILRTASCPVFIVKSFGQSLVSGAKAGGSN